MTKNPNTVIFIKGLDLGGSSGGADLFGANLALALKENNAQVRLIICYKFNTEAEHNILNDISRNGITPVFLLDWAGYTSGMFYLQALRKLAAYLKNLDTDIIHSHFHTGTLLAIWLKISGKVRHVVRTAHVDHEWQRGWDGLLRQAIIRTLIFVIFPLFVDLEVGVSTYTVEVLNQRFISRLLNKESFVIPNAIPKHDRNERTNLENRFTGWLADHPIIGSVGRLEEQKGYTVLIEALPEILVKFPDLVTWLIGDGPQMELLKEQCQKLGIENRVVFWGKQDNVAALLSKMDVFVSASRYEGLPTVVLEALDIGVPCVVTDIPGTRDIVSGNNVQLCRAGDSKSLADAINSVLMNPSIRKTLVENGLQTVDRFRIDNVSRAYWAAYQMI